LIEKIVRKHLAREKAALREVEEERKAESLP
jgi:hypothetical protein